MLYYGSSYILQVLNQDTVIYNLTSYKEGIPRLNLLPPLDKRLYKDGGRDFDMWYAEYIFSNDIIFFDFFKIVYELYLGHDVFLVIDITADWSENLVESLLKLIQQRYGYNGMLIDSFDSYIYAQNTVTSQFDPRLLYNLDIDKDRFSKLIVRYNPKILQTEEDQC